MVFKKGSNMEEMVKYLKALTFLQVQAMTGKSAFAKPEVLLSKAGFTHKEIGEILGKTTNAVSLTMFNERKKAK